jgi:hypothetical protein
VSEYVCVPAYMCVSVDVYVHTVMPNDPMKFGVDAQRDLGVDRLLAQLSDMFASCSHFFESLSLGMH